MQDLEVSLKILKQYPSSAKVRNLLNSHSKYSAESLVKKIMDTLGDEVIIMNNLFDLKTFKYMVGKEKSPKYFPVSFLTPKMLEWWIKSQFSKSIDFYSPNIFSENQLDRLVIRNPSIIKKNAST